MTWDPCQYPMKGLIVRYRQVSKPRDLSLKLSDRSEIWQTSPHHCCRDAYQISKRCNDSKYSSRGFETSRDITIRHLLDIEKGLWLSMKLVYRQMWLWTSSLGYDLRTVNKVISPKLGIAIVLGYINIHVRAQFLEEW